MVKVKEHYRNIKGKKVFIKSYERKEKEPVKTATNFVKEIKNESIGGTKKIGKTDKVIDVYLTNSMSNVSNYSDSVSIGKGGKVLYSYATPISYKSDDKNLYINTTKYSTTTSRHINMLKRKSTKIYPKNKVKFVDKTKMRNILNKENVIYSAGRLY